MIEAAFAEKVDDLSDHQRVVHHEGVADGQHDMVLHALHACRCDRDLSVIRAFDQHRKIRVERAVSGDDAKLEIHRRQAFGKAIGAGGQLEPGRSVQPFEERQIAQLVDQFAAVIGRCQHHHPTECIGAVIGQPVAQQDAAHGMGDEMDPRLAAELHGEGKGSPGQLFDPVLGRGVIDAEGAVALCLQRLFQHDQRCRAARQPVQEDHAFALFPLPGLFGHRRVGEGKGEGKGGEQSFHAP